jgi:hypothetical protein
VFVGSCLGPPFGAGTWPKKGVENDVPQQLGDAGFDSVFGPESGPKMGASESHCLCNENRNMCGPRLRHTYGVKSQNPSQPVHFGKRPAQMIPKADPPITRSQHVNTLQCKSRHREYQKQGVCQSGNPSMPREERKSQTKQVCHIIF